MPEQAIATDRTGLAGCIHKWPVEPIIRGTDPSQACTAVETNRVVLRRTHVLKVQAFLGLGRNKSNAPIGHDVPLLRSRVGGAGREVDPGHVFPVACGKLEESCQSVCIAKILPL